MQSPPIKLGFLGLARTTFDLALAAQTAEAARARAAALAARLGGALIGDAAPQTDAAGAQHAAARLLESGATALLLAQLTFTDAAATAAVAAAHPAPLVLWAFPEPRTGGRLRLNSPCGVNLAAHALGKNNRAFAHLHCAPEQLSADELQRALTEARDLPAFDDGPAPKVDAAAREKAKRALTRLRDGAFVRVGEPPEGFATCDWNPEWLQKTFGVTAKAESLRALFAEARRVGDDEVAALRAAERTTLSNLDELDAAAVEKTLRLRAALGRMAKAGRWRGAAVRCWPEMFTEFGGACCGAMSALGGEGLPCACEADLHGAVSAGLLQELTGGPAFLADWADCGEDGGAAFWHCGLAPLQMAGAPPRAALHSNRRMPLLREFPLRPGTATVARLTMARNRPAVAACRAEVVDAPRPFGGTCGVLKFARPAKEVFNRVVRFGLEHHFALAYGDVVAECAALAELTGLPFFPLTDEN